MFLVRAGLKNKKKVFVNKNTIPLKSSLVEIEKIKDEDGKTNIFYHYNVFVEVDKRIMIEQDIQNIEVEISKNSLSQINSRETMLEGVDTKNIRQVNLVANNAQKIRMNTTINKKNQINMRKVGAISSDDIYDSETASKIKKFNLPDDKIFLNTKKRYVIRKKDKETKETKKSFLGRNSSNFIKIHQKKGQQKTNISNPVLKFKRKYNKLIKAGQDPAKLILKNVKNNSRQSSFNFLKGRQQRLKKSSAYAKRNILNQALSNKVENFENPNQNIVDSDFELILENENDRNGILKQKIKISEKHFLELKKSSLRLIFIAKNKQNVSIDVTEGFINHFEEKKKLAFPNFDFEIEANKNFFGKVTLSIINNDIRQRIFNVYAIKGSGYIDYNNQKFEKVASAIKVNPRQRVTLFKKRKQFTSNRSVYFRVNLVHDGIEYSNTKFASVLAKSKSSNIFEGGITAKCDTDKITITAVNIPSDSKRVEIVRKNLSRKEKTFSLIKKIDEQTKRLVVDKGILIDENNKNVLTFNDDDVEKNNVYEYKINIYNDTGIKQTSSNSYIERYVEKKNLLNTTANIITVNETEEVNSYELTGAVKKIQTDADRVFESLFGNFYDLFKNDLSQVRDLNTLSYNLLIEVYKKETGELILVDEISVNKTNNFKKSMNLDNDANYFIKITPRAIPPGEIISKINNLLPFFSKKQRFLPVSAFNTAAIKKRIKNSNSRNVSYIGNKYGDRSNRLKSRINQRNAELQSKNYDLYFDGETGDNLYLEILSNNLNSPIEKSATLLEGKIKKIEKNTLDKRNDKNLELGEEKYLATFTASGISKNVDFFTMFYKENGNTVTDGLACAPAINSKTNRINYVFTLLNSYGKIEFFAQPITRDGLMLEAISIGSVLKDDRGLQ